MKSTIALVVITCTGLVTLIVESTVGFGFSREVTLDQWEPWSPPCSDGDGNIAPVQCPQVSVTLPLMDQDVEMKICDWVAIKQNTLSGKFVIQCAQLYVYLGPVKVYLGCAPTQRRRGRLLQTLKHPKLVD